MCFHTAREQGRIVAMGRRKAPCWRSRKLWKVLVVIAIQVEHTEEGMTESGPREGTRGQSLCIWSSVS